MYPDQYYPGAQGQNNSIYEVQAHMDAVIRLTYDNSELDSMYIGDQIFGADDMGLGNLDMRQERDILGYTGLVGAADYFNDATINREYSEARFYTGKMTISGMASMGKKFGYPIEETAYRPRDRRFAETMASDLPRLLKETEEWHDINFWADGETTTGGWYDTPIFCDGVNDKLQLLGRADYFDGSVTSNIVSNIGSAGNAMIYIADSYGDQFINEEGLPEPKYVTDIICGEQVGDILNMYYTSTYDIESMIPWSKNPRSLSSKNRSVPNIHRTVKLASPTDVIFLYNGWQDQFKKFIYWQNKTDSWIENLNGSPQTRRSVTQTRTFKGHYFKINRFALLFKGAPVVA